MVVLNFKFFFGDAFFFLAAVETFDVGLVVDHLDVALVKGGL